MERNKYCIGKSTCPDLRCASSIITQFFEIVSSCVIPLLPKMSNLIYDVDAVDPIDVADGDCWEGD